jgi:DNA-binding CsgD family transcriptional regulator/tetratricopeptide (TPR) repeat protein
MEIAALGRLMSRAAGGRGGLVAIEGPAGIGKSRLLSHTRDKATGAGWRVLDTRCTPISTTISYCLLRDWFGLLAHRTGSGVHPFDGPGQVLAELSDGSSSGIGDLVYGARWVLEDLTSDQPVLLMVDDLQWADSGSLQALDLLVNAMQHLPCLIVYAVRTGEPVAAPEALARIQQSSKVLALGPLSESAVATLVEEVDPTLGADHVAKLLETTGGVPFFVNELIANGTSEATPDTVIGSVAGRLGRISDSATQTARAICVLGPYAGVGTVAELCQLPLDVVADDIAMLVSAQLVAVEDGQVGARHPLIGQAVLAHMSASELAALHRRTADLLVQRGAPRPIIAGHYLRTVPSDDADVRGRLQEQGELALSGGANETAVRYFERALAEGAGEAEQVSLLSAMARARAGLGQIDEALAAWERAESLTSDPEILARLKAESGDALVLAGRHHEAQVTFGSLLEDTEATSPAQQRLMARMVMAGLITGTSLRQMHEQVERVLAQSPDTDSAEDRLTLAAGAVLSVFECESSEKAAALARRSLADGALLQEETSDGTGIYMATSALAWTSAFEESHQLLSAAVEDAQLRSSSMAFASASACRGYVRMRTGMVSEAIPDFEAALQQRARGWNAHLALVMGGLVECRVARGELDSALAFSADLERLAHQPGITGAFATAALGDLNEAHGDHERAALLYAEVGRLLAGRMDNPAILPWRAGQALAMIRLGQHREAALLARENTERARAFGAPYAIAQALRTQAAVDPTGDRVGLLREALETLDGTGARRLEAQIATDLAGMLVLLSGNGDTREVVGLLRRAEAHASFQELRPLSDRVQRLLERIGEPVRRSSSEAVNLLTVSERRVADLAASGMSNRQIAQQLFVTVKAVEWHLSNVYRKLGIRSRTRLPAVLSVPGQRLPPGVEPSTTAVGGP